jgi:hypothetical protein
MTQLSVDGPFDKRYLHHNFGAHPVCTNSRQAGAFGERRCGLFELVEPAPQIEQQLGVESSADLAGEDEVIPGEIADEQRPKPDACALGIGIAADDQLL